MSVGYTLILLPCMLIDSCICMIDELTLATYNLIRSFYAKEDCRTIMLTSLISRGYPP